MDAFYRPPDAKENQPVPLVETVTVLESGTVPPNVRRLVNTISSVQRIGTMDYNVIVKKDPLLNILANQKITPELPSLTDDERAYLFACLRFCTKSEKEYVGFLKFGLPSMQWFKSDILLSGKYKEHICAQSPSSYLQKLFDLFNALQEGDTVVNSALFEKLFLVLLHLFRQEK